MNSEGKIKFLQKKHVCSNDTNGLNIYNIKKIQSTLKITRISSYSVNQQSIYKLSGKIEYT